jgi:hypothetical protein
VFAVVAGPHLLARAARAMDLLTGRVHRASGEPGRVPGRSWRAAVLLLTVAVGAGVLTCCCRWRQLARGARTPPPSDRSHRASRPLTRPGRRTLSPGGLRKLRPPRPAPRLSGR